MSEMSIIPSYQTTASAISAGMKAFNAEAENIANQHADGYQASKVNFTNILEQKQVLQGNTNGSSLSFGSTNVATVQANTVKDTTPGMKVYDPSSANADADGFVVKSNVVMPQAMANSIKYSHYTNANWAVAQNAAEMVQNAIRGL